MVRAYGSVSSIARDGGRSGTHRLCAAGCKQGGLLLGREALPDRLRGIHRTRFPDAHVHQPARARRNCLACIIATLLLWSCTVS